jgi:hypothetical protein
MQPGAQRRVLAVWFARLAVGSVCAVNLNAALSFIAQPERYAAGLELSGVAGEAVVQAFGILFLMWNATYPLVILWPRAHQALFRIVLIQQAIGLAGETWIWLGLPPGHPALWETGLRFLLFDGLGLVVMAIALAIMLRTPEPPIGPSLPHTG